MYIHLSIDSNDMAQNQTTHTSSASNDMAQNQNIKFLVPCEYNLELPRLLTPITNEQQEKL